MKKQKFYLTTPIYYPSGKWHLGHCYTTVYGDAIARFKRREGFDVFYLTGTDEHGQKIEKRAQDAKQTPKAFVDGLVDEIKQLWRVLGITYDGFIRTTDPSHVKTVQKIFKRLYDQGDIYKSRYKGKYCTPCESFWTESQLKDGKCPDCGRDVIDAEEESYFFRLSKYAPRIRELLTKTDFLQPESRVNEMVNNFIDAGLEDLAVSRTSFTWGVPVEFDKGHIVYVWIDALSNYITALGYGGEKDGNFKKYWPADLHLMAKEIVRFHSIIWPAMLMALDLPLPKKVVGHGWLLFDGDKMSKSKGNVIDPFILADRYGADALRYYLLRSMPFGADGAYSSEAFLTRLNTDLCNDLGNLQRRTLKMAEQYFGGKITKSEKNGDDAFLTDKIDGVYAEVKACMDAYRPQSALEKIFELIGFANKYVDVTAPWVLFKEGKTDRLAGVMYTLCEALRVAAVLLLPFVPGTAQKILDSLGVKEPKDNTSLSYGAQNGYTTAAGDALFPRLDVAAELSALAAIGEKNEAKAEKTQPQKTEKQDKKEEKMEENGLISIDEFFRTQLKIAEVTACEKVEKADKLLKLTVKVGEEERTVVSGIAKYYTPEEMVGKKVVLVYNLKPAKLRGIESAGMLLCASSGDKLTLVTPETDIESGAEVC